MNSCILNDMSSFKRILMHLRWSWYFLNNNECFKKTLVYYKRHPTDTLEGLYFEWFDMNVSWYVMSRLNVCFNWDKSMVAFGQRKTTKYQTKPLMDARGVRSRESVGVFISNWMKISCELMRQWMNIKYDIIRIIQMSKNNNFVKN